MEVFKITKAAFSNELIASGRAHRWNIDDQFAIYTGSSRSLSSLELIVNENSISPAFKYKVMIISIADEESLFTHILQSELPHSWRTMASYPKLQQIGSEWYMSKKSLILKVPSAVIPKEYNYVINAFHPDFKDKVSLVRTEDYFWDDRLL
ncbi:RES family NAD+ phosphorylase [Mucilaginibacter gotjawali]|uniref:RES domain-containing protein n=2 Tax=Mucilaginibacter gotjawali TaxID=1550579 RepID=A0A839SEB9_9SPHI|nr:RES family NAD+ phosphorylase [Mucilaginibacter gotjawali]MBB3055642.1 RES domain-containing protein [Mucilaginibacter gotjawali]BAU53073.1 RES domain protein [Mucilaginibacter gotjawali]